MVYAQIRIRFPEWDALWDYEIQTDPPISAWKSDLAIIKEEKKHYVCTIFSFRSRVNIKKSEKKPRLFQRIKNAIKQENDPSRLGQ